MGKELDKELDDKAKKFKPDKITKEDKSLHRWLAIYGKYIGRNAAEIFKKHEADKEKFKKDFKSDLKSKLSKHEFLANYTKAYEKEKKEKYEIPKKK